MTKLNNRDTNIYALLHKAEQNHICISEGNQGSDIVEGEYSEEWETIWDCLDAAMELLQITPTNFVNNKKSRFKEWLLYSNRWSRRSVKTTSHDWSDGKHRGRLTLEHGLGPEGYIKR